MIAKAHARGDVKLCTAGNAFSKSSAAHERSSSRRERPTQVPNAHNARP